MFVKKKMLLAAAPLSFHNNKILERDWLSPARFEH